MHQRTGSIRLPPAPARIIWRPLLLALALLPLLFGIAAGQGAAVDPVGDWTGAIGPGTLELGIRVTFERGDDGLTGAIDIPAQGAVGLPLEDVALNGNELTFSIRGVPGEPTFEGQLQGDRIEGIFRQGGQELRFVLERAAPTAAAAEALEPFVGRWEGTVGPGSLELGVLVTFAMTADGLEGSIDIPVQGALGLPLEVQEVAGDAITFAIFGIPGEPTFRGRLAGEGGNVLEGTFEQGGQSWPFVLERLPEGAEPQGLHRPQEPQPPFPYRAEEVRYPGGGVTLAATLTLPEGPGPFPAVLLITGSGPQDRDETIAGHRPFLVLADRLTRDGFAVLRADDRGVGGSEGDLAQASFDDLAADILGGVAYLRSRPEIGDMPIGLLGHSEGGYLAPLAADRSDEVAFIIMLAGPSVPGIEVLKAQNEILFRIEGALSFQIRQQLDYLDALYQALRDGDFDRAQALTRERVRQQLAALPPEQRPSPEAAEALIDAQAASVATPNFRSLVTYDPQPVLRRLELPLLAFYGQLDVQVPFVQNVGPLRAAMRIAGNDDATIVVLERHNHLMQRAITGSLQEYAVIEETISPEVLERISGWLQERFGR